MVLSNSHEGWNDLPEELLLRILRRADDDAKIIASWVCRDWKEAVTTGTTKLTLSWCEKNANDLLLLVSRKFPRLQVLNLRQNGPRIHDDGVESLSNFCHDLRELDLRKCLMLTDKSLFALSKGCPNLSRLNISGCSSFGDFALAHLVRCCRGLRYLNLCGCVRAATDHTLKAVAENCEKLEVLNLGWCESVTDDGIVGLAGGCSELRTLDLCGCVRITDESVIALAKGCRRMESLDLYYCRLITDKAMYALANSRAKRKYDGMEGEKGLKSLNISQCTALTLHAVQAVCDSFPSLHTCVEKHSLMMSGCLALTSVHCGCIDRAKSRETTSLNFY